MSRPVWVETNVNLICADQRFRSWPNADALEDQFGQRWGASHLPSRSLSMGPRPKIAIKYCLGEEPLQNSGDHHFAAALAGALSGRGWDCRLDPTPFWYARTEPDDVVLCLRGRWRYRPSPRHLNLLWVISHPAEVTLPELRDFDHVFAASESLADTYRAAGINASALLQCTDPAIFSPGDGARRPQRLVFIANSRNVERPIATAALKELLPLEIYGRNWEAFEASVFVHGQAVANDLLPQLYREAIVFNDHWTDMAAAGILSNRLFDAAACAAPILSDRVPGIEAVFGGLVSLLDDEPLARTIQRMMNGADEVRDARLALAAQVRSAHSFEVRADEILHIIAERMRGFAPETDHHVD